ncbi:MAG: C45 family autoproteolytic acyltransferase/hydrolase [Acidobacteriota bacterium]
MRVLSLQGNHYQMGLQHGKQVRDIRPLILSSIDTRLHGLRRTGGFDTAAMQEVRRVWSEQARSTLAMLEGIGEALDIPLERLFQYAIASYLEDLLLSRTLEDGCTVWAAAGRATQDGTPLLSKNRDYFDAHIPMRTIVYAAPHPGYRCLYITSAGSPGVFSSGMNEKGLVLADTHVASRDIGPGLARFTLMTDLLEQHAHVREAVSHLRSVTCMGAGNLVLLDAQGDMAVFENGFTRSGLITATDDYLVATNHFVSEELANANMLPPGSSPAYDNTRGRHATAQSLIKQARGTLDVKQAKEIASYHGSTALCRHRPQNESDSISAAIYLPVERQLLFCNGWPCQGSYETYRL